MEEKNKKDKKTNKITKYVKDIFGFEEETTEKDITPVTLQTIFSKENAKSLIILGAYLCLFIAIFVAAAFNKEEENTFEQDEENNTVIIEEEEENTVEEHYQYLLDNNYDYKIVFNINNEKTNYVGSVENGDLIGYSSNEEVLTIEQLNNIEEIYNFLGEKEYTEDIEGTKVYSLTPEEFNELYPDVELIGYSSNNITITTVQTESYISSLTINLNGHVETIYEIEVQYTPSIY